MARLPGESMKSLLPPFAYLIALSGCGDQSHMPGTGVLRIRSTPPAAVAVDGEPQTGTIPLIIELVAASHEVSFSLACFADTSTTTFVNAGDTVDVDVSLRPRLASSVRTIVLPGAADGECDEPLDIVAASQGFFYVNDRGNERIQKFTLEGDFVYSQSLPTIAGLDIVGDDSLFVLSGMAIRVFTSNGEQVGRIPLRGTVDDVWMRPQGLAVCPDGSIVVGDFLAERVRRVSRDGTIVMSVAVGRPSDLTVAPSGTIYVVSLGVRIQPISKSGQTLPNWGSRGHELGQFIDARGIESLPTGDIFVVDSGNGRVQRFGTDGKVIANYPLTVGGDIFTQTAVDVGVTRDCELVVTDTQGRLYRISTL